LESHLRQLALKNGLSLTFNDKNENPQPKKASTLNDELAKAGAYLVTNQKRITAWFGLRNDAAHGLYQNYTKEEIDLMVKGITNFLAQFPA
jgi:hypothetical protein